jgi:peptide/nickel transport system permease protein
MSTTPVEADVITGAPEFPEAVSAGAAPVSARRRFVPSPLVLAAVAWLVLIGGLAITADWLRLLHPYNLPVGDPRVGPGFRLDEPLGTDYIGRSQLSRVIYGARVSLAVGLVSVGVGMLAGGLLGMIAGYVRGAVDAVIGIATDAVLAFPPLVLLLALTGVLTQSLRTLIIALSVLSIPSFARLARANTLVFAQRDFVLAARALGARHVRILLREILPNVVLPVGSYAFLIVAAIMVAEGSLSFLGLGIPPPAPSWGGMIASGKDFLSDYPWEVFVPAAPLLLTVLAFNMIGDWARRRFDVQASKL